MCPCRVATFCRFEDDIQFMLGERPNMYFKIMWKYVSPVVITVIIIASLINLGLSDIQYKSWDFDQVSLATYFMMRI